VPLDLFRGKMLSNGPFWPHIPVNWFMISGKAAVCTLLYAARTRPAPPTDFPRTIDRPTYLSGWQCTGDGNEGKGKGKKWAF
jgi:hypothetical protein